jgi:hypothetical protein
MCNCTESSCNGHRGKRFCTPYFSSEPVPKRRKRESEVEPLNEFPKGQKWKTDEGFRYIHTLLYVLGFILLCSRGWWANVPINNYTKLKVMCDTCKYVSEPSISSLQQGHKPSCWCNGSALWQGEQGRQRILWIIEKRKLDVDVSAMTTEWWSTHIVGRNSKLLVRCNKCEFQCTSTIHDIKNGRSFGCFCSGAVQWSSEDGYDRFMSLAAKRNLRLDLSNITKAWWKANITRDTSPIIAPCLDCGYMATSSLHNTLYQRPGCWCNGGRLWRTRAGYERIKNILRGSTLSCVLMSWEWWQQHIVNNQSKLLLQCTECGDVCKTTDISSIQQGKISARCSCRFKTESILFKWLEPLGVVERGKIGCVNPSSGRKLPYDFFITTPDISFYIELDGDQHFGWNHYTHKYCAECPKRDKIKEDWVLEQGQSLIRLYQPHVYSNKGYWKAFVHTCIEDIKRGGPPRIYTPDIVQYREGLYHELRAN